MGLFDIFSFKKDFTAIFNQENIKLIKNLINTEIKNQIKKNIPGQEKMDQVIAKVILTINEKLSSKNAVVQWIIDNVLIKSLRLIIQSVYDDLKEVVKGL